MGLGNIAFPASHKPEEVLAEIQTTISKYNPNIGRSESILLKEGPRAYKYAIIFEILNAGTQEHHHLELQIGSYTRTKSGWTEQEKQKISLNNVEADEIGFLEKFINNFKTNTLKDIAKYGIIEESDYQKLSEIKYSSSSLIDNVLQDAEQYDQLISKGGSTLLKSLLEFSLTQENPLELIAKLQELNISSLQDISSIAGISQLKQFLQVWKENASSSEEEYWQQLLTEYSWAISQLFSYPLVLFKDKAYLGGKNVYNKHANLIDFIFQNQLSTNAVLIEIKTPATPLLGSKYRQTYSLSNELSGAINQLLKYKHKLQRSYTSLVEDLDDDNSFKAFNPRTLLIAGTSSEIDDSNKIEAFELFRSNSKDIEIITFDELFTKTQNLLELLEGTFASEAPEYSIEDIPF